MTESSPPALLSADAAARLAEFSRVCKAAARAVSLYPGGHPAIGVSLARLEQATARMTDGGPYSIQVLAEGLVIDGARMPKPDPAVSELAHASEVVLTTGGTGLGPRDVTPEAMSVLERRISGIPEALRSDALTKTPHGMLSRGLAGTIGSSLVVNLPGSPGACRDGFAVLQPILRHAVGLLTGQPTQHRQT